MRLHLDLFGSTFESQSIACVLNTRRELATLQKGDKPIDKHINDAQKLTDRLAQARKPISEAELITNILSNLGSDYDSSIVSITTHSPPLHSTMLSSIFLTLRHAWITMLHSRI